ncbi:MAG: endonuclease domain-containing protein [Desulfovermiculus sp.]|nr:endonuclease domain-containing protein [Desulfovermiculus sp.]
MPSSIHNRHDLKEQRRTLRKEMTSAEARLWSILKGKQLDGRKFRRQQSLGPYIVDFYCPAESLVIELDGEVHNDGMRREYDANRQKFLQELGLRAIRFENRQVFEDMENVIAGIRRCFGKTAGDD